MTVALFDIVRCSFPDPLVAVMLYIDDTCAIRCTATGGWPSLLRSPRVGTLPVWVTRMNNVEHRTLSFVWAQMMFEQPESADREAMTPTTRQDQAVLPESKVYACEASYSATGP